MTTTKLPRNVWLLASAQALLMSVNSCVVFVGGLVGAQIAPSEKWSTFPVACGIAGTALLVIPITSLMQKMGRKKAIFIVVGFSVLVALFAGYTISIQSFWLFCVACLLFGATASCVMQFRFAAMESVLLDQMPAAASTVLLGGIAAAFIGPEVALLGRNLISEEFVGSFLLLAVLFLLSIIPLTFFRNPVISQPDVVQASRPLREISRHPLFRVAILSALVGYMVMSFIMTATPVSMHFMDGHSLGETKWVIQSHIVAMFLPSLVTGRIITRFGIRNTMVAGLLAYLVCIGVAVAGHDLGNYWISLILLGVGWNFLFIGGTTLLPASYRPEERFRVQAANDFTVFGTQAVASASAGWFVFSAGWEFLLLITVPVIVFQLVVVMKWGPAHPTKVEKR